MVRDLFGATPDIWQEEVLEAFPHQQKIAMKASKGPGKTTVLAWLAWNYLLTRPHPKIAATSINGPNLEIGLWTEMAVWQGRSPLLKEAFEWTKTRIRNREHPDTWYMASRSWRSDANNEELGQTLAGIHADYVMFLLDESGGMPTAILAAAEAALSSCKEGHVLQAGNPNSRQGALYFACVTSSQDWFVVEINGDPDNPKRASRVNIEWARSQIRQYGRDDPFVMVDVLGQFPPADFNSLISYDELVEATRRRYFEGDIASAPKIIGVDVAREGDDTSVIFPRQGLVAFQPQQLRNITGTEGANLIATRVKQWGADAVFIDDTGGFGSSWIDNLNRLGHAPVPVKFNGKAVVDRYANKRTEMAYDAVAWIRAGGAIPDIPQLLRAMSETTYTHNGDRLVLEPKESIKRRLEFSPDHFDALMLTFAAPVEPVHHGEIRMVHRADFDPMSVINIASNERRRPEWHPFQGGNR
jgi:phage terminase large subunit